MANTQIYQLKITLKHIKPPIWRKVQVKSNITLNELHLILNAAMGWTCSHLHDFTIDDKNYAVPDPEFDIYKKIIDDKKIKLNKVLIFEKTKFTYTYDFGDDWEHEIILEKILPIEENVKYPICLKGKRNCPPEDCGSIPGYENLCKAMKDPTNPEHEEILEWVGGEYDPEYFDLEDINDAIKDPVDNMEDFL
jgi:hypothetical protein